MISKKHFWIITVQITSAIKIKHIHLPYVLHYKSF